MIEIQANPTGGVFPEFYVREVEDKKQTKEAGRPIFKDVEYVRIMIAGDKLNIPEFKVTDEHKNRWPEHYKAFKEGREAPINGTPIDEWQGISRTRAKELRAIGIRTVEDLASLHDNAIQRIGMGARELVQQAKAFLDDEQSVDKLREKISELEAEISELKKPKKKVSRKKKVSA